MQSLLTTADENVSANTANWKKALDFASTLYDIAITPPVPLAASKPASKPATPSAILQQSRTNLIAASKERQRRRQAPDWQDEKRKEEGSTAARGEK